MSGMQSVLFLLAFLIARSQGENDAPLSCMHMYYNIIICVCMRGTVRRLTGGYAMGRERLVLRDQLRFQSLRRFISCELTCRSCRSAWSLSALSSPCRRLVVACAHA